MSKPLHHIIKACQGPSGQRLRSLIKEQPPQRLVIYFFRRGFSPRCLLQAQDFSSQHQRFQSEGTTIIGISRESTAQQQEFAQAVQIPFALVSDEQDELCRAFGLLSKSSLGQQDIVKLKPSTFLFDTHGNLIKYWLDCQTPGMVQQVLLQCQAQQRSAG